MEAPRPYVCPPSLPPIVPALVMRVLTTTIVLMMKKTKYQAWRVSFQVSRARQYCANGQRQEEQQEADIPKHGDGEQHQDRKRSSGRADQSARPGC